MTVGRPLKFKTVEELEKAIQAYFDEVAQDFQKDANGIIHQAPLTITGLALALDTSRKVLMEYEERDEYSNTVKRAKTVVENYAEKRLFGSNATGAIFALKNFGWKDKNEVDQRYVDKDGEDLHSKDLEIINNYENRIRSHKDD